MEEILSTSAFLITDTIVLIYESVATIATGSVKELQRRATFICSLCW